MRRVDRVVLNRQTARELARLTTETRMEQATIRAISAVSEYAISEVQYLKQVQHNAEHSNVDAADAVAAIVNLTVASIARRVSRFGNEVDW
ncbi:hypothetical protein [Allorhizocola rhizosphaerae]|uniref:hypothetical protein n=1 Tax=Allorhizocola rhizosphaerae TaxID=1872709 RepID=UPI0013C2D24E|nr:hypothetical protein [Allorhizocola rhizosphaerae]